MKNMKRKKPNRDSRIRTGDISNITGSVNIAGGDIRVRTSTSVRHDASSEIIIRTLAEALTQTRKRPNTARTKRAKIEKEVKEISAELDKKKVDKGFLAVRFKNLAKMAPDILDVIITGFGNPAAGIGMAVKKIAQKAKIEAEKETVTP